MSTVAPAVSLLSRCPCTLVHNGLVCRRRYAATSDARTTEDGHFAARRWRTGGPAPIRADKVSVLSRWERFVHRISGKWKYPPLTHPGTSLARTVLPRLALPLTLSHQSLSVCLTWQPRGSSTSGHGRASLRQHPRYYHVTRSNFISRSPIRTALRQRASEPNDAVSTHSDLHFEIHRKIITVTSRRNNYHASRRRLTKNVKSRSLLLHRHSIPRDERRAGGSSTSTVSACTSIPPPLLTSPITPTAHKPATCA